VRAREAAAASAGLVACPGGDARMCTWHTWPVAWLDVLPGAALQRSILPAGHGKQMRKTPHEQWVHGTVTI
jgi:hypothetical protein